MKSGFAVVVGRSNVGKSTLVNSLVGTKVSIITPKPQTTRHPVQAILTIPEEGQAVFVDTPGLMQKAKDPLTKRLNNYIQQSLKGIDVVLYVVDATRSIGSEEKKMLQMLEHVTVPKLLVINKMDDENARNFVDFYRDLAPKFSGKVEVSAAHGSNLDILKKWIFEQLPEGEMLYPEYTISNMSKEEQLAEIIREKLFLRLREEVPYSVHVVVDEITKRGSGTMYVHGTIYTNDERYKRMIIGAGGVGMKEIGQSTRRELETITGKKFYLDLSVEVDKSWVSRLLVD